MIHASHEYIDAIGGLAPVTVYTELPPPEALAAACGAVEAGSERCLLVWVGDNDEHKVQIDCPNCLVRVDAALEGRPVPNLYRSIYTKLEAA